MSVPEVLRRSVSGTAGADRARRLPAYLSACLPGRLSARWRRAVVAGPLASPRAALATCSIAQLVPLWRHRLRNQARYWGRPCNLHVAHATVGWVLAALGGFACYFRLARTRAVNSDGASQALQAWDLLHGNVLLHGWALSDVSFYTTEIPEYALVEVVRGLRPDVVPIAAAATYTLVVLFAAALATGTATGRAAAARALLAAGIMLAPPLGAGTNVLLSSPDHIGTSVPVLLTWLIIDRAGPRRWVPVSTSVLLAWAMVADQLVLLIAIVPLAAVCALRVSQWLRERERERPRARRYELALAGGAVVAGAAGAAAPRLLHAIGGYSVQPLGSGLAPAGVILHHNLAMTGRGLLLLAGAYDPGQPAGAGRWFVALHVAGVALTGGAVLVTACRFHRGADLVSQLLLTGIVVNIAAYALGTHATILANTREMAPVLPFAAALAGRRLPGLLTGPVTGLLAARPPLRWPVGRPPLRWPVGRPPLRWPAGAVLGVVLAGYAAGLGLELTAPVVPPQNARLTAWLERHPLGAGLSGYWQANVVAQTSGGAAVIRPVAVYRGRVTAYAANVTSEWYAPGRSAAHFVVLAPDVPGYGGFTDRAAVVATFGAPTRIYLAGPYTILWWRANLLTRLPPGTATPARTATARTGRRDPSTTTSSRIRP